MIAFKIWGHLLSHNTVVLITCRQLSGGSCHQQKLFQGPITHATHARLMVLSLTHNIHFRAKHIEGVNNIAADLLSRLHVKELQARFPYMDPACTPVSPAMISL